MAPEATPVTPQSTTNKRKRGNVDQGNTRPSPGFRGAVPDPTADMEQFAGVNDDGISQLIAHNSGNHDLHQNGGDNSDATNTAAAALTHYQMQPADVSFQSTASGDNSASFNLGEHNNFGLDQLKDAAAQAASAAGQPSPQSTPASGQKPPVGSEEWHRVRRDNHKEVERRRRETINEGINELAKIVPGCEKNKGSILQRAVQYIAQLKENEAQNIEKWTLEKLLLDQAITELSTTAERMKTDAKNAWHELDIYKRACQEAAIVPEELKDLENEVKSGGEV